MNADEREVVICEGWDAAIAAKPDDYTLEVHLGWRGAGYVRYEPPSRPGNRGPRRPRYVEGFGWPTSDSHATVGAALLALTRAPGEDG